MVGLHVYFETTGYVHKLVMGMKEREECKITDLNNWKEKTTT